MGITSNTALINLENNLDKDIKSSNEEIIIKNYSYIFNTFSPIILFFCVIIPLGVIGKYIKVLILGQGEIGVTFYISILLLIYIIKMFFKSVNSFIVKPPIFIITKDNIIIDEFLDSYKFRHVVKKNINTITKVRFILNSETHSYGKVNKNSLIKRFFKDDIGDGFIEIVSYYLGLISFFFFYLPIKIIILLKNREKLSLLKKNFLIEFSDNTACVINIYSESNYKNIYAILKENQIKVDANIVLSINLKQEK